jgi:hypothetical protein
VRSFARLDDSVALRQLSIEELAHIVERIFQPRSESAVLLRRDELAQARSVVDAGGGLEQSQSVEDDQQALEVLQRVGEQAHADGRRVLRLDITTERRTLLPWMRASARGRSVSACSRAPNQLRSLRLALRN